MQWKSETLSGVVFAKKSIQEITMERRNSTRSFPPKKTLGDLKIKEIAIFIDFLILTVDRKSNFY